MSVETWQGRVVVTSLGLVTPVGLHAAAAAAAMRAGVSRLGDLPGLEIEGADGAWQPVTGAMVPGLPEGLRGPDRLVELATAALAQALDDAALRPTGKTALYLGLPGVPWAGRVLDHRPKITRALEAAGVNPATFEIVAEGRAAGLLALRRAAAALSEGRCEQAVVGAVDSWVDTVALRHLQSEGRLREGSRASGVLPGEAGAFLVLETAESAQARGIEPKAVVTAAAGAIEEEDPRQPGRREMMTAVLQKVGEGVRPPAPLVISDLNGERHRAFEWMFAFGRGGVPHSREFRHLMPASSIGDAGAGLGGAGLVLAADGLARGYAREGQVVVWGSSDEGAREAVLLEAVGVS